MTKFNVHFIADGEKRTVQATAKSPDAARSMVTYQYDHPDRSFRITKVKVAR